MKEILLKEVADLINAKNFSSPSVLIKGFAIDSRLVKEGELFFALIGKKVDGHSYLKEVSQKGAVAAVVQENYQGEAFGLGLIRVPDVKQALQDFGKAVLRNHPGIVVGITGSLGKTSTKGFLETILKNSFRVFATPASYNSQVTLPLSILMTKGDEQVLLFEMSMSEPGNLKQLVELAPPDIAVLTNVAKQHTNNFSDGLAGVAREKAMIFSHPKTRLGFLPTPCPFYSSIVETGNCPKKTFSSQDREADFFYEEIPEGIKIYQKGDEPVEIPLNIPIKAHYQNFLAAVVVARELKVSWEVIQKASKEIKLPPMRFEKVVKQGIVFINDAFNANPDSLKAALESLPTPDAQGRKIAVISEMDALGEYTEEGHTLVAEATLKHVDLLLAVGQRCQIIQRHWEKQGRSMSLFSDKKEMGKKLKELAQPGDVILLKGARSYALDELLKGFD